MENGSSDEKKDLKKFEVSKADKVNRKNEFEKSLSVGGFDEMTQIDFDIVYILLSKMKSKKTHSKVFTFKEIISSLKNNNKSTKYDPIQVKNAINELAEKIHHLYIQINRPSLEGIFVIFPTTELDYEKETFSISENAQLLKLTNESFELDLVEFLSTIMDTKNI